MAAPCVVKCLRFYKFSHINKSFYNVTNRFYTIQPPEWLGGKSILNKSGKFDFPEHSESFEERMKRLKSEKEKDKSTETFENVGIEYSFHKPDRKKLLEISLKNKRNKELEKQSRLKSLLVPLNEIKRDWLRESGPQQIKTIADHYNIYKDLFGGNFFYPVEELKVHYDYDDEYITPVYFGNFISPQEASQQPHVSFNSQPDELWAVLMTNPDENLTNQDREYVHWLVVNIPGNDLSKGQTLISYMPPIPSQGTGYHRNVFILFKQKTSEQFQSLTRVTSSKDIKCLEKRQFSTYDFYQSHRHNLVPHSLAFFQSQWDESVRTYFRDGLDMGEPVYEYNHPTAYHPPAKKYPHREPFNIYFDRYRDKRDINEEVLRIKLASTTSAFEPRVAPLKYPLVHRSKKYKPSWLVHKEEMMARKVDQFKDLE